MDFTSQTSARVLAMALSLGALASGATACSHHRQACHKNGADSAAKMSDDCKKCEGKCACDHDKKSDSATPGTEKSCGANGCS